jgi:hypothetical protein
VFLGRDAGGASSSPQGARDRSDWSFFFNTESASPTAIFLVSVASGFFSNVRRNRYRNSTFARAIHHYRLPTHRLARHPIAVCVKSREPALLKVEPGFRA